MRKVLIIFTAIILILPISCCNSSSTIDSESEVRSPESDVEPNTCNSITPAPHPSSPDPNSIAPAPSAQRLKNLCDKNRLGFLTQKGFDTNIQTSEKAFVSNQLHCGLAPIMNNTKSFFTENKGQVGTDDIKYYIQGQGVWFTESSIVFDTGSVIELNFQNCNDITPIGLEKLPHKSNFFYGNNPDKWCTDVPNYAGILYENIYDNIDLKYYFNKDGLKYDFLVHPGGNPGDITIKVDGAEELILGVRENTIDLNRPSAQRLAPSAYLDTGHRTPDALTIKAGSAEIVDSDLFVYQQSESDLTQIKAEFELIDSDCYGFELMSDYDRTKTLVIDPLIYSTFIGGFDGDWAGDIELDNNNNLIIAGGTNSFNFLIYGADLTPINESYYDIFVLKLSADGSSILFSSLFGGNGEDEVRAIAVDPQGNSYITGITNSSNFPMESASNDTSYNGLTDVFVFKLNPAGNHLMYSTYIGGSSSDLSRDITVDDGGNAYVTGYTNSMDFPVTLGAYNIVYNHPANPAFIFKLDQTGSKINCSTFFGGEGAWPSAMVDEGVSIALSNNSICILGTTTSPGFPTTKGAYDTVYNGIFNSVFISKFSVNLSALLYSTIFEGSSGDTPEQMFIDNENNIYIVGVTASTDLPLTSNAYDSSYNGDSDGFCAKFNSNLSSLLYSTYFGGDGLDIVWGAAVDDDGNICITGDTTSQNFPVTENAYDKTHNGNYDIFAIAFNLIQPTLIYSSYYGSPGFDLSRAITLDKKGFIYISGACEEDFPITQDSYSPNFNGGPGDAFALKLELNCTPVVLNLNVTPSVVYRPAVIDIYSNVSDFEDDRCNLTPHFEWWGPYQIEWTSDHLRPPVFKNGSWRTAFNVSTEIHIGYYNFRVRYNDTDTRWTRWLYLNYSLRVLNNIPKINHFGISRSSVELGENISLKINATDIEDDELDLKFELKYKKSDETFWVTINLGTLKYKNARQGLFDKFKFEKWVFQTPEWDCTFNVTPDLDYGYYDFKVRVYDTDSDYSGWMYLNKSLLVLPATPKVLWLTLSHDEQYRIEFVEIYINCSDPDSVRDDLFIELQFISKGESTWYDLYVENVGTHWVKSFKIPRNCELGYIHDFRTRVTDMEENTSPWMYLNGSLKILNNDPRILNIDNPLKMYRGKSICISINVTDKENTENELLIELEYKMPGGQIWFKNYLSSIIYSKDCWQSDLRIPVDASLGLYSFRARVQDLDWAWSEYQYWNDTLNVSNSMPEVRAFHQTPEEVLRTDTVLITASGTDWETSVEYLKSQIYYQAPSEGGWKELLVEYDEVNAQWYAELVTTRSFELGNYSFKVTIQDDEGGVSNPVYDNHTIWVQNNPPVISLKLDDIKVRTEQIKLNLTEYGYDIETSGDLLIWNIDYSTINKNLFRIDGTDIEQHQIIIEPLHNKKGNDDITLILVDTDGGYVVKANITIIVDSRVEDEVKPPGPDEEDENIVSKLVGGNLNLFIILLIVIIIVTIILFMLHHRRKQKAKKAEEAETEELTAEHEALYGDDLKQEAAAIKEAATAPVIEPPQEAAPVPMPAPAEAPMLTDGTIQQEREGLQERREETGGERREDETESEVEEPKPKDQELPEPRTIEPVEPVEPPEPENQRTKEPVEPLEPTEPSEPENQRTSESIEPIEPNEIEEKSMNKVEQ